MESVSGGQSELDHGADRQARTTASASFLDLLAVLFGVSRGVEMTLSAFAVAQVKEKASAKPPRRRSSMSPDNQL
jgi:uncharacterized membrane protein YeiB